MVNNCKVYYLMKYNVGYVLNSLLEPYTGKFAVEMKALFPPFF